MWKPVSLLLVLAVVVVNGKPPHIIFIVADDLGWNDVGWHNPNMYTPNLDKLALNGVRLNSSYVQPVCTPSRNCFMSGYYPYHTGLQHGVIHPPHPGFLPANFTTLPQKLKALGYSTHIVGKWHLGFCNWKYTPTYRGFDSFMGYYNGMEDYYTHIRDEITEKGYDFRWNKTVYSDVKGEYSANVISKHAIDLINNIDPETQPLYLYLPFQSVHAPLEVPERYKNLPPYRNIKHANRRTYCGMVSALDEAIGNITDALKKRGFMNNSLIVFTTDNGGPTYEAANNLPLRGAKTTLWEGGTKGAAFVYSDNLLKKTKYTSTEMIHAVDWYPTLLTVAGGKPDPKMDGRDQWPMISEGKASARNEFVYNIDQLQNNSAIRVGKYKLIQGKPGTHNGWEPVPNFESPATPINFEDDEIGFSGQQKFPPYQLFDLEADPTEHFDIADKHPDIVEDMKKKLEQYKASEVPPNYPPPDPKSNPDNFGGNWSPGWC